MRLYTRQGTCKELRQKGYDTDFREVRHPRQSVLATVQTVVRTSGRGIRYEVARNLVHDLCGYDLPRAVYEVVYLDAYPEDDAGNGVLRHEQTAPTRAYRKGKHHGKCLPTLVLESAEKLQQPFSFAQLLIQCFTDHPQQFRLSKEYDIPCSNKLGVVLSGGRGLCKHGGLLERVAPKMYRVRQTKRG